MNNAVVLLVHVGAPSSRKDDERYLTQAEACVHGSTHQQESIQVERKLLNDSDDPSAPLPSNEDVTEAGGTHDGDLSIRDTQFALTSLESRLISSSLAAVMATPVRYRPEFHANTVDASFSGCRGQIIQHNAKMSRLIAASSNDGTAQVTFDANNVPPDRSSCHHSLSSYLISPILDRQPEHRMPALTQETESGVLCQLRSTFGRSQQGVASAGLRSPSAHTAAEPSRNSPSGHDTASELPTSYSLSERSCRLDGKLTVVQRVESEPGSQNAAASSDKLDEDTRRTTYLHPMANYATSDSRVSADIGDNAKDVSAADLELHILPPNLQTQTCRPESHEHLLTMLPTLIRPRMPDVSITQFTSHVTDTLRFIAEESDVRDVYKPISVARSLEPLERGHWLISTAGWSCSLQHGFWCCLQDIVGTGNAGWGVWCCRTRSEIAFHGRANGVHSSQSSTTSTLELESRNGFGPVEIHCWGEVVKHIYQVLYIASRAQVRKHGLQWIDSEGKVVVQMRQAREPTIEQ